MSPPSLDLSTTAPAGEKMHLGHDAPERLEEINRRVARMVDMVRNQNRSLDGLVAVRVDDLRAAVQEIAVLRNALNSGRPQDTHAFEQHLSQLEAQLQRVDTARPARTRFYDWLGGALALGLIIAGLLALLGARGPGLVPTGTAVFALGVAVAVVGVGVLVLALSFSDLARRVQV